MDESPATEQGGKPAKDHSLESLERKSGVALPPYISKLREKLGQKAKQEPTFRFYTLYDRICRRDVLTVAWWLVFENDGAAGVDGISCQDIMNGPGATPYLDELHEDLRPKRCRPQPVKRVYIPSAVNGGRPVSIS